MHDDLIAALEAGASAVEELAAESRHHKAYATANRLAQRATLIRDHIATLRAGGERPAIVRIDPAEYQDGVYLNPVTGQVIRIETGAHGLPNTF